MSLLSPLRLAVKSLDIVASRLPRRITRAPLGDAGVPLSPLLHWMLHLRHLKNGSAEIVTVDPADARRQFRADILPLQKHYPVREVSELSIPGPAGALKARHYLPERDGALPALLVFLHGGGFVIGDLDTHDDVCRLICREAGLQVLSVDYRLAPEHPFPAAAEDAEAAVRWAQENFAQFGVLPGAIAVGGDSAGGNLAAVVAQRLGATKTPLLAQFLIYPATDTVTPRASQQRFGTGFFLSFDDREWFHRTYSGGNEALKHDPRFSPLLNPKPGVLAPAFVVTSGFDVLRDEGEAYVDYLRAHGTSVEHVRFEHLGHGFVNLAGAHRDSELALLRMARQFRLLCNYRLAQNAAAAPVAGKPLAVSSAVKAKVAVAAPAKTSTVGSKKSTDTAKGTAEKKPASSKLPSTTAKPAAKKAVTSAGKKATNTAEKPVRATKKPAVAKKSAAEKSSVADKKAAGISKQKKADVQKPAAGKGATTAARKPAAKATTPAATSKPAATRKPASAAQTPTAAPKKPASARKPASAKKPAAPSKPAK